MDPPPKRTHLVLDALYEGAIVQLHRQLVPVPVQYKQYKQYMQWRSVR